MKNTLEKRFWAKVNKGTESGCWEWTARTHKGYGQMGGGSKRGDYIKPAHRISWEIHFGPIPDGLWVLHKCDNRKCVNPDHLFLGTVLDNTRDMDSKGRGARGIKHPITKLNEEQVLKIKSSTDPITTLAERFNVTPGLIRQIYKGIIWKGCGENTRVIENPRPVKLTQNDANEIRKLCTTISRRKLARMFGVGKTTILNVINGHTWKKE